MFTALKQETIITALHKLTEHCFKNAMNSERNKFLCIGYNRSYYTKTRAANTICLSKLEVMELILDVVSNSYIKFGNFVFKQIKGTSMGSNASCSIADCTLLWHEFEGIKKLEPRIARAMSATCRYVDDFCTFSTLTDQEIIQITKTIYPPELNLELTVIRQNESVFLDTHILLTGNNINIKVYNKTDAFPFPVIRYCCSGSMVHTSLGYKVFYGELHRFAIICTTYENFQAVVRETVKTFIKNGYHKSELTQKLFQFCVRNQQYAIKFGIQSQQNELIFTLQTFLS